MASRVQGTRAAVAATADGGRTWRMLPDPCPGSVPIADAISAVTPSAAYLLCVSGNPATIMEPKALLRPRDGGRAWTTVDAAAIPGRPAPAPSHGLPINGYIPGMIIRPDGRGWL